MMSSMLKLSQEIFHCKQKRNGLCIIARAMPMQMASSPTPSASRSINKKVKWE